MEVDRPKVERESSTPSTASGCSRVVDSPNSRISLLASSNRIASGGGTPITLLDLPYHPDSLTGDVAAYNSLNQSIESFRTFASSRTSIAPLFGMCVYLRDSKETYLPGRSVDVARLIGARKADELDRPFANITAPCQEAWPQWQCNPKTGEATLSRPPHLTFESRFESGNLRAAVRVALDEYDLVIDADTNSGGCMQWFFFAIGNGRSGQTVKLNLLNCGKKGSLLASGMRPVCFSKVEAGLSSGDSPSGMVRCCPPVYGPTLPYLPTEPSNVAEPSCSSTGWSRDVSICSLLRTGVTRSALWEAVDLLGPGKWSQPVYRDEEVQPKSLQLYTFSFSYTFKHDDDIVFFALAPPYTCSRLYKFMDEIAIIPGVRRKLVGRSLAGNRIECVDISDPEAIDQNSRPSSSTTSGPRTVVILGRTHPGETMGSFAVEGLIRWLLDTPEGLRARTNMTWKIFPMVNPDGVVNGNYRCSLAGKDLNRIWIKPTDEEPEVVAVKSELAKLFTSGSFGISLLVDFHGHSKRLGWFSYGCMPRYLGNGRQAVSLSSSKKKKDRSRPPLEVMFFPWLWSITDSGFDLRSCNFSVTKDKVGAARVALHYEFSITHCFTVECSFGGLRTNSNDNGGACLFVHYSPSGYQAIGAEVGRSVLRKMEICSTQSSEERKAHAELLLGLANAVKDDGSEDSNDDAGSELLDAREREKRLKRFGNKRGVNERSDIGPEDLQDWDAIYSEALSGSLDVKQEETDGCHVEVEQVKPVRLRLKRPEFKVVKPTSPPEVVYEPVQVKTWQIPIKRTSNVAKTRM